MRRNNCIYATLGTCYSVWMTVCYAGCTLHSRQSSTQNNKYQESHRYSCFSWWWARSPPKHVEKRNKHTKKNCATSWFYLQDYTVWIIVFFCYYHINSHIFTLVSINFSFVIDKHNCSVCSYKISLQLLRNSYLSKLLQGPFCGTELAFQYPLNNKCSTSVLIQNWFCKFKVCKSVCIIIHFK